MKLFTFICLSLFCVSAAAQCPKTGESVCSCNVPPAPAGNPEIEILLPPDNGTHIGVFFVQLKNVDYRPDLATDPVTQFAVGTDKNGDPLKFGEGHIHGWVFKVNATGRIARKDANPSPVAYLRFYGAGGATVVGNKNLSYYTKFDTLSDLKPGRYRVFFQVQHHDHTAMTQINAPAFPAISSRDFYIY